jgi:hypothetical protein
MNANEAIALAKKYFAELFSEERPTDLGLEEIEFDDTQGIWSVTLGFSRSWQTRLPLHPPDRSYKVVRFQDSDGRFISVKSLQTSE